MMLLLLLSYKRIRLDERVYLCMLKKRQCTVAQEAEIMVVAEGYPIQKTRQDG